MYNYLKGTLTEVGAELTVDCGGVGYNIVPTYSLFANSILGQTATVYVHLDIKETSHTLYGFASREERELFRKLIGVNGVGPRVALSLLSIGHENLVNAVLSQNVAQLAKVKGVSTKTAEKVILDLRTKLTKTKDGGLEFLATGEQPSAVVDAIVGLVNLGLSKAAATDAVAAIPIEAQTAEQIILQVLNRRGSK